MWYRWAPSCVIFDRGTWTYINNYPACIDKKPILEEALLMPMAEEFERRIHGNCSFSASWGVDRSFPTICAAAAVLRTATAWRYTTMP